MPTCSTALSLIFSEIIRIRDQGGLPWSIHFWRTKDGEEVDFVIENGRHQRVGIEAKLGGGDPLRYSAPREFQKTFGDHTPIFLTGLNNETKDWRHGIKSVHPLDLATELLGALA